MGRFKPVLFHFTKLQSRPHHFDPADIRIVFPRPNIPLRTDDRNYSTYSELTGITRADIRKKPYFYLFRHGGLGVHQLSNFRRKLMEKLS